MIYFITALVVVPLAGLTFLIYSLREARSLQLRRFTLDFPTLPPEFDGYRIVFASDFHIRRPRLIHRKTLAALATVQGDLLVLGGDFQERKSKRHDSAIAFIDALGNLAPRYPDGILAVRGNHDNQQVRAYLQTHPAICYLDREALQIRRGDAVLTLAGTRKGPGRRNRRVNKEMERILVSLPGSAPFRILIAHWPDYFPAARKAGFDLVLSGDTHGGQLRLPLIGAPVKKTSLAQKYAWGLVRENGSTLYTTSGIGTQMFPLRFLCPPEIISFELQRSSGPRATPA